MWTPSTRRLIYACQERRGGSNVPISLEAPTNMAKCKENANGGCCAAVIHEGTKTETRKLHTTRAACDPSSALMQHVLGMDSEPERPTSQESREPRNSTGEKRTTILSSNATRVAPKKAKGPGLVAYMLTRRSRARDRNRKKKNLPLLEGRSHRPRIFG